MVHYDTYLNFKSIIDEGIVKKTGGEFFGSGFSASNYNTVTVLTEGTDARHVKSWSMWTLMLIVPTQELPAFENERWIINGEFGVTFEIEPVGTTYTSQPNFYTYMDYW